jgi:myosin heavy subunit
MKNLHLVYPSDVILSLKKALENEGFFISGMDYTLEQFKEAAAAGQVDTKSIIIIEGTAGIGRKSDIYTNLREIRSFLPTTRLIVQLASDMKKDIKLITPIVHLAIYDIHFVTEFGIEELKEWIHFEKTIADYSQIIGSAISKDNSQIQQANSTYVENKSTPTKGGGFFSKLFSRNPGDGKPGSHDEQDNNLRHDKESRSSEEPDVTEPAASKEQGQQTVPQPNHHEAAFSHLEESDMHLTLTTKKTDSQGINAYQRALEEDNFNEAFTLKAAASSESDTKHQKERKNELSLQAAEQAELERQKAELESKQVELERQKAEQVAKQAELERQKAEQEEKQAELERQKAEQAQQLELERQEVEKAKQAELERQQAEPEEKQAELERQRAKQEQQAELQRQESEQVKQAELERQKAELNAQQAELERQRAEQMANQAELERQHAEKAQQAELDRQQAELAKQAELERQHAELEAKQAELERQIAEQEAMQADLDRQKAEQEAKQAELERHHTQQVQLERQETEQAKQSELERSKIAARKREQDSNLYDMFDDDVELTKRTVVFKERIVGTVKLGVAGAERRTGTTYQALQTSYYLASLGFKVACVENLDENRSSTFATFRTDVPAHMSKGFTYKKVDFYPQSTIEDYVRIVGSQYDYVVADFGDVRDEKTQLEFMRCDVQIMTIGAAVWDFKDFSNVWKKFSHWEFRKVWHVLVNFADDEMYKEMTGAFSKKDQASLKMSFIKNPYVPNPLQLTTDQSAIERMVRSVIPKQDLKKKWFGR